MLWCPCGEVTLLNPLTITELSQKIHRICFALSLFHFLLALLLIGVKDTRDTRAAIQNGYDLLFNELTLQIDNIHVKLVGSQSPTLAYPSSYLFFHPKRLFHFLG